MSNTKSWEKISLEDILRVDSYGQQIYIYDSVTETRYKLIRDNREFFTQIYADTSNNIIDIVDGSQINHHKILLEDWISEDIGKTENSLVIFIEGYAGCGKSTFVQYLLSKQLKNYNYEYEYYNYDIGANSDKGKSDRIVAAIREGFIWQLIKCLSQNKKYVIDKFKELISQKEIKYLDSEFGIYNEFINVDTFDQAISYYKRNKDEDKFRSSLHKQLKGFSCTQILALDYVFRLSYYITSDKHDNSLLYVCYDNMDSIENSRELKKFANILVSMRKNIDEYINETYKNYHGMMMPHFVIITTYRKITAAKIESSIHCERIDDYSEYNQYIQYVDASHFYSYYDIIEKREEYFSKYIKERRLNGDILLSELSTIKKLIKTDFVHDRYAGLWNNNYRTCSTIFHRIIKKYYQQVKACESFIDKRIDGYDESSSVFYGASAIFLSLICKVFHDGGMWGEEHMNLVELNNSKKDKSISELTSLSRLLLTYISNNKDYFGNISAVSTLKIFNEFGELFKPHAICRSLANMLARDRTDTWRRPIYYHRNAINNDENIEDALIRQWEISIENKNKHSTPYTELLLCECGYAFIERLSTSFEYFSNRISNDNRSLYLTSNIEKMEQIIKKVYEAVKLCCEDMITFSEKYMEIKGILNYKKYINAPIHPRTISGKPQLHTERIIFSHISYLNHCRLYYINMEMSLKEKKKLNDMYVSYILKYLTLYMDKLLVINSDRKKVAEDLQNIIKDIEREKEKKEQNLNILFQSISNN